MDGIYGIYYKDQREPAKEQFQQMVNSAVQRDVKDEFGFWSEQGIGLAHYRMTADKDEQQPISNEDGTCWIVYNGIIYNATQLREQLQGLGRQFKTKADAEVILHLYEQYGEACVDRLRGGFSFVIWDRRERRLFAARDHFGIKPFYYSHDDQRFAFSSEMKSLLQVEGAVREVKLDALANYLTFQYVPDPDTMIQGIQKLPPAHMLRLDSSGHITIRRYWDPMFTPVSRPLDEYIEALRERFKESIRLHMQGDTEQGAFLSSGIDSTSIATLMRQIGPIKTFSVGFEGERNETKIAAETAKAIDSDHYARVISEEDYFDSLAAAIRHLDEPVADPSAIALYHVMQLAKEHVPVVLSGEGADELFGGYRIYREPLALKPVSWLPPVLQRLLNQLVSKLPLSWPGRNYLLRGTTPLERRFLGNARIFSEDMKAELFTTEYWSALSSYRNPWHIADEIYNRTRHLDPVSRMQYIDLNLWLPGDILAKANKMAKAHALDVRMPILDKEMFELARNIPASMRIAHGTTKYVFRKAMEGIVPDFILHRPKLGFPVPLRDWLKGPRGLELLEEIKASGSSDYFNVRVLERDLQKHRNGQGDHARKLWTVYIFSLWYETYLGKVSVEAKT